jgi:hypothetical protein
MRSETLPEEYATDAIVAIDHDRWETVGVVWGVGYDFTTDPEIHYVGEIEAEE